MLKIQKRTKKLAVIGSFSIAIAISLLGLLTVGATEALDDFVFASFLTVLFPITLLNYFNHRWEKAIDEHLPDLFRSIVQAQETGMTLPNAFEAAAKILLSIKSAIAIERS